MTRDRLLFPLTAVLQGLCYEDRVPSYSIMLDSILQAPYCKTQPGTESLPGPPFALPCSKPEDNQASIWQKVLNLIETGIGEGSFDPGVAFLEGIHILIRACRFVWSLPVKNAGRYRALGLLAGAFPGEAHNLHNCTPGDFAPELGPDPGPIELNMQAWTMKNRPPMKHVLLVGATGFLGAHILDQLIQDDQLHLYCLVRGKDQEQAATRLLNRLEYYFPGCYHSMLGGRIQVLTGDASREFLGLDRDQHSKTGRAVDTVINCAALVKHYGHWNDFERSNIDSTRNLIAFCREFDLVFHHVSTTGVSGGHLLSHNHELPVFTENDLDIGQAYRDNHYVHSKFLAEKLVREAMSHGLAASIYRVGMLTGRYQDGVFQPNVQENGFYNRLKAMIELQAISEGLAAEQVEFTPVDACSRALVQLARMPESEGQVFHLFNRRLVQVSKILDALAGCGYNISRVSEKAFKEKVMEALSRSTPSDSLLSVACQLPLSDDEPLTLRSAVKIRSRQTETCLQEVGFAWPEIDEQYLDRLIKHMSDVEFI